MTGPWTGGASRSSSRPLPPCPARSGVRRRHVGRRGRKLRRSARPPSQTPIPTWQSAEQQANRTVTDGPAPITIVAHISIPPRRTVQAVKKATTGTHPPVPHDGRRLDGTGLAEKPSRKSARWISVQRCPVVECDGVGGPVVRALCDAKPKAARAGAGAPGAVTCVRGRTPGRCAASCGGWECHGPYYDYGLLSRGAWDSRALPLPLVIGRWRVAES